MKASPTVPVSDEKRNSIRELADELHNRLNEVQALSDAVGAVAACTSLTVESLTRLRHTIVSLQGAVTDAGELMAQLRGQVKP